MGPPALLPIRKEGVLRIFIALKNPSPWPGSNPQPLGPVASTLTITPPRRLPNVAVEWLTLLLRIREVPGSKLGPGDRLSRLRFFVVFLSPPGECRDKCLTIRPRPLPTISYPIHHYSFNTLLSMLYSLVSEKAS
jgi:hypothetical protein